MKLWKIITITIIIALILGIVFFIYYTDFYTNHYPYSGNASSITEKELECGAYYGFYNQKKPGTPDNWVWRDVGKSSNWHSPNGSIGCLWSD